MTGSTVGHYEIREKLGEGGMGMVYKARDLLLNRSAALKFLPAETAGAEDMRRRFLQEAQSASALNHPNIITIYEIAQSAGRDYIAMELVQGRSLADVIASKPLPLEKALTYAIQIADALAAAHAAGIVHRDLKPGNVMIADSGLVKVLDFGLAKLVRAAKAETDVTKTFQAEAAPQTVAGAIVGTISYMSPEQAEGKPVDHRSDIFSFGALCYEMLTGRRAFKGDTAVSTLAAILTAEPAPLSLSPSGLPAELVRIVTRCLRKAPEKRSQSIADVRIALDEFKQDLDAGRLDLPPAPAPPPGKSWLLPITAAVAAVALAFAGWQYTRTATPAPAPELWKITRVTADSGVSLFPAISQDGKLIAYVSDRAGGDTMELWVRQIEGGDPVQLTRGLGSCRDPAFSPDGSRIALHCGAEPGGIYVISTFGGLPKRLGEGERPQWSPDGARVSYLSSFNEGILTPSIWVVPANGGSGKELKVNKGLADTAVWTPDSKGLLFIGYGDPNDGKDDRDWYFVPVDDAVVAPVGTGAIEHLKAAGLELGRNLTVTPGGVVFAEGNADSTNIYRMPFDAAYRKASGDPVPIVVGAGLNFSPTSSRDGRRLAFAVGSNLAINLWRAPVDAATGKVSGDEVRITGGVDPSRTPSPAGDGKRLAYLGGPPKAPEVRLRDLATGKDERLAEARSWSNVVLSKDGSVIAFNSDQRTNGAIYSVPASGGVPKKLCSACGRPIEWGGQFLLFDQAGPKQREIQMLDLASGQTKPLLQYPEQQVNTPRVSPDGKLLCFTLLRPGRARRLYIAPFTGEPVPEKDWTVVVDGANLERQPFWAPSGNLIYFVSDRDGSRCIWAQRMDLAARKPIGTPFAAHHLHQLRHNLMDVGDPAAIGLSIAGGQMFYASFELNGNIWLAERGGKK